MGALVLMRVWLFWVLVSGGRADEVGLLAAGRRVGRLVVLIMVLLGGLVDHGVLVFFTIRQLRGNSASR